MTYELTDDELVYRGEEPEEDINQPEDADAGSALFEGDQGELDFDQRKTLVTLLKRRYLSADKNPREWRTLLKSRSTIEIRLNEMFQVLVFDEDRQFAYKRAAFPDAGESFPTLLYDRQYSLEETVLLVELRDTFARKWSSGQDTVHVDREELLHILETYRRADSTNNVDARRREAKAIDGLVDEGILIKVDGDTERLRVAPVINSVLTVEKLRELRQWVVKDVEGDTEA